MTDSQHSIEQVSNLFQYFRAELTRAFEKLGLSTSSETETYLIHLLEGYARLDEQKLHEVGFDRPAAFFLRDALQSGGDRRIEAYRRLGDASLFSCGFFEERFNRRGSLVKSDYYRSMGRSAYSNLQTLMEFKAPGGSFHTIFKELSRKFDTVVDAFRYLSQGQEHLTEIQLIERWQRGDKPRPEDWRRLGILPSKKGGEA